MQKGATDALPALGQRSVVGYDRQRENSNTMLRYPRHLAKERVVPRSIS